MAWEITRPPRTPALHGVDMAGFRIHGDIPARLRAIPHPAVTVAVNIGDHCFDVRDSTGRTHSGSLALGLTGNAAPVRVQAIECVQVRLSPVVASAILGFPLAELTGNIVALDDLWGRDATRLSERLHETCGWHERFALIETTLSARLRDDRRADPEVAWAWRQLILSRGRFRVERLAAEVGWSRQRLWSRFGTQIGLTPKRAAMLVRFDHAVHRLVRGHSPAQVAADSGYADQSHLHRDVRGFTGTPPSSAASEPWLAVDDKAWPSSTTG
ncbi:helix-turn-helix domain-containing protein [Nocardia sp. NPDC005366]|uniref:helix-turn-helix domain-containing protein n=1 Tax=Nocardia sp. NPDC005366 TaxID=3156878 RepID=UPI0033B449C2